MEPELCSSEASLTSIKAVVGEGLRLKAFTCSKDHSGNFLVKENIRQSLLNMGVRSIVRGDFKGR